MDASGAQVVVSVLLICSKGARHRTSEAKTGDVHYQEGSIGVELSDKTNDLHPLRYIYGKYFRTPNSSPRALSNLRLQCLRRVVYSVSYQSFL